jgi:hypothetical protein
MADNNAMVPIELAKLNITFEGEQGDLPDMVSYDSTDGDIKQIATEAVRGGDVPGIDAAPNASFEDFVVDRFPAKDDVPFNRLSLRPKTEFGAPRKCVYKYKLLPGDTGDGFRAMAVHLPRGAVIRHVGVDFKGRPCIWAEVYPDAPRDNCMFYTVATGAQEVPDNVPFAGTIFLPERAEILHLYGPEVR